MKRLILVLINLFLCVGAHADMVPDGSSQADATVLDDAFLPQNGENEPLFSRRQGERDLAAASSWKSQGGVGDWQGQLSVMKEIPYSYPQLNSRTLALRVLAELEDSEK